MGQNQINVFGVEKKTETKTSNLNFLFYMLHCKDKHYEQFLFSRNTKPHKDMSAANEISQCFIET